MKKKIMLVTERRADYTKLKPILNEIKKSKKLDYYLVVTGSHLLKDHGYTIKEIQKDDFKIYKKFHMYEDKRRDFGSDMVHSFGRAIIELSKITEKLKPDIILTGFDIGAHFAAAVVGAHMNIHVAHIEGGEVSGTIDDSIRHATTKFAHIHFTSNIDATNRIIKMGENPKNVYTVGNPALDNIKNIPQINQKLLEKKYNLDLTKPFIILLQHTVTSEINNQSNHIISILDALKQIDIQSVVIIGNADAGSKSIIKIINNSKLNKFKTIPYVDFINLVKLSSGLVGNSSSGIIETPFLKIPTVNIGSRQIGRLRATSIVDTTYNTNSIKKSISFVLNDNKFRNSLKSTKSLYGNGNSSKKIIKILENLNLKNISVQKQISY
jgi:GDP/UDP-N,N'-diacetylbacillosamine 2-epimerase (hydrolysing)